MNSKTLFNNFWKFGLALLFFLAPLKECFSQVSAYTFAQSAGTYTAITGGTNYNNFTNWNNASYIGTLPNATAGFLDDNVSAALQPIGFNFVYNGVTYTQFGICTNGWISLGGLPTNSSFPVSGGTTNNIISAMGADLIGRGSLLANRTLGSTTITITGGDISQISIGDKVSGTGIPAGATVTAKTATTVTISAAATTTGTGFHFRFSNTNYGIRYQTIGTAPNRTLVVQWTGWQRYTTTGVFGEVYNFQIRLNETTNTINVVYNILGPSSTTLTTFEVGLRGSANTDFNNRTTTTSWAASAAGTLNSSTMNLSNTVRPTSGQTYTWTPPSCVAPTALTSSSVTTTSATISWNAASPVPSNGYQYYFSTSSIAPTAGTTPSGTTTGTSVNLTGLTSNVTYYFWVRSNCGGTQSTWAGSSTFFTGNPVCTNTSSFGSATAGTTNTPVTISTCNWQGDYSTVSGIVSGNTYSFGYSLGGWITVRIGTSNGTVAVSGNAPVTWTATTSGTVFVHYNTNSACGTASLCGTSTVTCTSCAAPPSGCTNLSGYPAAFNAPTTNTTYTIATDQWQEEFNQVDNVTAGSTFQSSFSLGGFITVRFGTYNGTVVASGNSTLTWTATTAGSYFIHYTVDNACNTATLNGTSTLTCTSCANPTPPANDLVCNAIPITCNQTLSGQTTNATNSGTGEGGTCGTSQNQPGVWYVVAGTGGVMTASLCATAWDSKISVFSGTNCSSLTCVGGNDDNGPACAGSSASFSWTSVVGTNYYILVHAFGTAPNSNTNTFSISLNCPPTDPTSISASSTFICEGSGNSVTLTANGAVGTVYWFSGSCGTTGQIGTGNSIVVSPTATTYYFARNFNNSQFSTNCASIEIEVRTPPTVIAGANTSICLGNSTQLGATVNSASTLTILTGGTNGCGGGNMFNITTDAVPVRITSFDITPDITGTQTVNVYYRNGSYVGNETTAGSWILLGSYSVTGTADVLVNMPITSLNIPANSTFGIYINYNSAYSNGDNTFFDENITVSAGVGLCSQFGGVNLSRTFNGRIYYDVTPTLSWTPTSTLSSSTIANPIATPTSNTTYTLVGTIDGCSSSSTVNVTVNANPTATPSFSANPICNGNNTTLNANATAGSGTITNYAWSSGIVGNNSSGSVSTSGTYRVTVTNSNGCTVTATSPSLTVNANPTATPNFTSNPICSGSSVTLNANATAGSGTISNYSWSSGITGNNASGNVSNSGTYTVTVTNSNGCTLTATSPSLTLNTLPSVNITASSTTVCEGSNVTLTGGGASTYSWSGGITNGQAFTATTGTTNYSVTGTDANGCTGTNAINLTVNTLSTSPSVSVIAGRVCPNTNTTLNATGGIAGTGSTIRWYSAANGGGTLLGTGSSITIPFAETSTVYVRREGTCNNSPDSIRTVNIREFRTITVSSASTPNYCVDNNGWGHWYNSNDEIIFSVKGDFSMCASGYPSVTVSRNPTFTFYNQTQNPTSVCASNGNPGEMRFEMGRNWNVDFGGATPSGLYSVRFYHLTTEKSDVVNAAIDTINTITSCGYGYKYNVSNNGWFWFKNVGTTYVAPQWDGVQYDGLTGTTVNGVTYVEMDSIPSFSGGSGGVILIPSSTLPIEWKLFTGQNIGKVNRLNWITATETETDYFELERGFDGINFEGIILVAAAGNSTSENYYNWIDENPLSGINYYRLKLWNLDGTFEYSDVIALEVSGQTTVATFYPNPTTGRVTYAFEELSNADNLEIEIFDAIGKRVSRIDEISRSGLNTIEIDLSDFSAGTYNIRVLHKNTSKSNTQMIIKR